MPDESRLSQLRAEYLKVLKNHETAPEVYEKFKSVANPSAKIIAYTGALEAIMTKTTWNVFKKVSYLRKSEASFNQAVQIAPKDLEIRFMRMAVQYEIPSYMGFSEDMEADRKFIVNHIEEFNPSNFDQYTLNEIFRFMKRCERFTPEQISKFKGILALT